MSNIVLLYCDTRTGHFGMGAHTRNILQYLKEAPNVKITVVKTDSDSNTCKKYSDSENFDTIEIPKPKNKLVLFGNNHPVQIVYAQRIADVLYRYLRDKSNLILWSNTIDNLNLCRILKATFDCKLLYVHHNFSWKVYLKTTYQVFAEQWENHNANYHSLAFEYTGYQQQMALLADHVITVTQQAEYFFRDVLAIPAERISTIYNGIAADTQRKNNARELRKKYGFSPQEKIILFCGRIVSEKGIDYLASAFKLLVPQIPESRLVIIGNGDIVNLLAKVAHHWSKVTFTGELAEAEVFDLYSIANVGVMPSTQEQCSFTAIEMRFHKVPLIVSAVEGLDETFEDGIDCLKLTAKYDENQFIYFSINELAEKIRLLITNQSLANQIADNGYEKALLEFTAEKMSKEYLKIFLDLKKGS